MIHALGALRELHLARVLSNADPENRARIEIELVASGLTLWAPCVVQGAGRGYGLSVLPREGEVVVVAFLGPDEDNAVVLGAVWSGGDAHPEEARPVEDVYLLRTPSGCQVRLTDRDTPEISIETPSGAHITISDAGEEITLERGDDSVVLSQGSITITATASVTVDAETVTVDASTLAVNADMARFSGVVQAESFVASMSVASASYLPGAGQIW